MSIDFLRRSLFDIQADIRVNTVNTVGVMGKGIALQFKQLYPDMFESYRKACLVGECQVGKLHVWHVGKDWIINLPTKIHWRNDSRYEYIDAGLLALNGYLSAIATAFKVALPQLGCGNGGLDYAVVKPMIALRLADLKHHIIVSETK